MGDLFGLTTSGFEENGHSHTPVNPFQGSLCVGVQGPGMAMGSGDISIQCSAEAGFADLSEYNAPEFRNMQGRRAEGNERFGPGGCVPVLVGP